MAAIEEAKRLIYEKAIKKFTIQDVTKHKGIMSKNLVELISRYPGNGQGFKVSHRFWPDNTYYHVRQINLFSARYGRLFGVKYENGQIANNKVERIREVLKRGLWRYQLNDPTFTQQEVTLDNGASFNIGELHAQIQAKQEFMNKRSKMMEVLIKDEPKAPVKGKLPPKKK